MIPTTWPPGTNQDRRPIGQMYFRGAYDAFVALNPRINYTKPTAANIAAFLAYMQAGCTEWIAGMVAMNAQGCIVWDLDLWVAGDYRGDPRILNPIFPWASVSAVFKRIIVAGLRVGCCVRSGVLVPAADGLLERVEPEEPGADLAQKVMYAYKTLGCTLFYVDSNVDQNGNTMPYGQANQVQVYMGAADYAKITMIWEHTDGDGSTCQNYHSIGGGFFTPQKATDFPPTMPNSCWLPGSWNFCTANDFVWDEATKAGWIAAMKAGNIMSYRALWPGDPYTAQLRAALTEAGKP